MKEKRFGQGRTIRYSAAGILVLALLLAYLLRRGYEPVYLAVLMGLAAVSVVWHLRRALAEPAYLLRLTGAAAPEEEKKRQGGQEGQKEKEGHVNAFDHLRFLALCGVIVTHAVQIDIEANGGSAGAAANVLWVVTMAANAAYVMLSGALLYRRKEEKASVFYLRKFSAVVIPLVVYYLWYLSANYGFGRGWHSVSWRDIAEWLLTNRMKAAPHTWLVYAILSVYLTGPFFRIALRSFPYKKLTGILSALFVCSVLIPILNATMTSALTHADVALEIPFSGWLLVSLYGYWASLEESRRYDKITIPLGAAALAAIAVLAALQPGEEVLDVWCVNEAALPVMLCVGLFALVFRCKKIFDRSDPLLRAVCRYSYGIILIHWYTLHFIVIGRFHIRTDLAGGLGTILSLLLTLVISWVICFIIDNLIILPIRLLWNKLFRLEEHK